MKIKGNYMRHPFPFHEEYNVESSCNFNMDKQF